MVFIPLPLLVLVVKICLKGLVPLRSPTSERGGGRSDVTHVQEEGMGSVSLRVRQPSGAREVKDGERCKALGVAPVAPGSEAQRQR